MIPSIIIMVLAALGVWLLRRTVCINTRFIIPPAPIAARTFLRKTRRGWEGLMGLFGNHRYLAWNVGAAGPLADEEKDALLRECFDLGDDASDDDVRQAANEFREGGAADNAALKRQRTEACQALGLEETASNDEFHEAIIELPKELLAANAEVKKLRKDLIKSLLDYAIKDGRITQAQRGTYETAFNSDFEKTRAELSGRARQLNTEQLDMKNRKQGTSSVQELGTQVAQAEDELMAKNDKLTIREARSLVRKDPRFKEYFDQTNPEVTAS